MLVFPTQAGSEHGRAVKPLSATRSAHWPTVCLPTSKKGVTSYKVQEVQQKKIEFQIIYRQRTSFGATQHANVPHLADFDVLQNAAQVGAQYFISYTRFHQGLNVENDHVVPKRTTCDLPVPLGTKTRGKSEMVTGARQGNWFEPSSIHSSYPVSVAAGSLRRHPLKSILLVAHQPDSSTTRPGLSGYPSHHCCWFDICFLNTPAVTSTH